MAEKPQILRQGRRIGHRDAHDIPGTREGRRHPAVVQRLCSRSMGAPPNRQSFYRIQAVTPWHAAAPDGTAAATPYTSVQVTVPHLSTKPASVSPLTTAATPSGVPL